ncbi:hypothetical protein [Nostoc sp.]
MKLNSTAFGCPSWTKAIASRLELACWISSESSWLSRIFAYSI